MAAFYASTFLPPNIGGGDSVLSGKYFFFAYICKQNNIMSALHKSFLLTICSVNVAKSVGKCRFGHIY